MSNDYRSFWNRVSGERNAEVRGEVMECVEELFETSRLEGNWGKGERRSRWE